MGSRLLEEVLLCDSAFTVMFGGLNGERYFDTFTDLIDVSNLNSLSIYIITLIEPLRRLVASNSNLPFTKLEFTFDVDW